MSGLHTFVRSAYKVLTRNNKKLLSAASLSSMGAFATTYPLITNLDNLREAAPVVAIYYLIMMFFVVGSTLLIKFLGTGSELKALYLEVDNWILCLLTISPIVVFLVLILAKAVKLEMLSLPWKEKTENL